MMSTWDDERKYEAASEKFPDDAHKTDRRGGTEITYVEGETVISRLNKVFVYGWEFEILEDGIHEEADEAWCRGRLTVWRVVTATTLTQVKDADGRETATTVLTESLVPVKREQYGSQKLKRARSTGKILDIGFDKKGAATDALKKCASLHGVALYLWNKEELAILKAQMEENANGGGEQQGDQGDGSGRKLARPNRPQGGNRPSGQGGNGQQPRPIRINGIEMPLGFHPPFALVMSGRGDNDCHASGCDETVDPEMTYKVGTVDHPGTYVIERSRQEAGCVLCVSHTAAWFRAKQAVAQPSAAA
jgi:hypothetical protein